MVAAAAPLLVEIPSGLVIRRELGGIPLVCALGIWCGWVTIFQVLGWFYGVLALGLLLPVWGFLQYHTRKDPVWCDAWLLHVQYSAYYHA